MNVLLTLYETSSGHLNLKIANSILYWEDNRIIRDWTIKAINYFFWYEAILTLITGC